MQFDLGHEGTCEEGDAIGKEEEKKDDENRFFEQFFSLVSDVLGGMFASIIVKC